jgi:hypothetical protein
MTTTNGKCKCGETILLTDDECEKCRTTTKELFQEYKKSFAENPPPPEESMGTVYTGKCSLCSEIRNDLIHSACKRCRVVFNNNPRIGRCARQIRSNPELAQKFFSVLSGEIREAFITIFGIPDSVEQNTEPDSDMTKN